MPPKAAWPPPIYVRAGKDVVRLRLAPGKYREVTLGPAGSAESRQEYARIVAEIETHGRPLDARKDLTVAEVTALYLRSAERDLEPRSYARAKRAFAGVCKLYARRPAVEFGPLALATVREAWVGEELSRRYINHLVNAVKSGFRWAVTAELLESHRAEALGMLRGLRRKKTKAKERPRVKPADPDQVQAVLTQLPPALADVCRLLMVTGARPGEILALQPADVVRPWKVVDGVELWLYRMDEHKTAWKGHHRWIPLGPRSQAILGPYLDGRDPLGYCFSPREVAAGELRARGRAVRFGPTRDPGEWYCTEAFDRIIRRACRRAFPPPAPLARLTGKGHNGGFESRAVWMARLGEAGQEQLRAWEASHSWRPNQLRHSRATEIETEYGREDARCVLGHRTATTTAIYAESVDRAAKVMAAIG